MLKIISKERLIDFIYALISEITKIFKISFIFGSKAAFFSISQCLSPLVGLFSGTLSSFIVLMLRIAFSWSTMGIQIFSTLYHIPTFCGALYLSNSSKFLRIMIPLACMITFICHPIGSQAFIYSFYWFIPIAIALINPRSIFLQTLGSTFTQHAVGSIIWLYCGFLNATSWNALIAVVWAERLLFALTMTLIYHATIKVKQWAYETDLIGNFYQIFMPAKV